MMALLLDPNQNLSNKILVIGNGPSVQEYKFGKQIDSFEIVLRINNYKTIGFEEYVGLKTSIWSNGANQNLVKKNEVLSRILVFIPPNILQEKGDEIHNRIQKRLGVSKDIYELVPIEKMKSFEQKCGCERLTTGTNSILWAVENFEKVVIHGFDFFQNGKEHYFDSKIKKWFFNQSWLKKGEKHNLIQEKKYIEKLLQSGNIIQLKDFNFDN